MSFNKTYGVNVWRMNNATPTTYLFPTEAARDAFIADDCHGLDTAAFSVVLSREVAKAYYKLHKPSDAERTAWKELLTI